MISNFCGFDVLLLHKKKLLGKQINFLVKGKIYKKKKNFIPKTKKNHLLSNFRTFNIIYTI